MDPMEEIRQTFFIECEELLENLESGLLAMNEGEADEETVNSVFRAVHSIKGGAGAFALENLVAFAHKFETTLDEVRAGRLEPSAEVMNVFLRSADVLSDLVTAAQEGADTPSEAADGLIGELLALIGAEPEPAGKAEGGDVAFSPMPLALGDADDAPDFAPQPLDLPDLGAAAPAGHAVHFRPHPRLYELGSEPVLLIRALSDLGEVSARAETGAVPRLDAFDWEKTYLSLDLRMEGAPGAEAIEEVFEFVDGECDLKIEDADDPSGGPSGGDPLPPGPPPADESPPPASPPPAEPAPLPPTASQAAPAEPAGQKKPAPGAGARSTVRVDLDRVDRLVNLIGELVISQAAIAQCVENPDAQAGAHSSNALEEFKQLTREIQDSVMAIRTQPVKPLFQRMQRIVREAAAATGKSVRLKTEGETTEVDKTVIERLADPLTHMIRNAVDHGLEGPGKRLEAGKDEEGTVCLNAAHQSGRVVIEISDDGAGINRERVRAIAVDKGLIHENAPLSDAEIDNLLFAPGFSTAKEVSNLSGRGVGMDVVKRAIQALGGRISIASQPGRGTTFSISLPLTLAVLDGMVVTVEGHTVVVPLTAIVETLKPLPEQIHRVGGESPVIAIRDSFIPIVDLGVRFGYRSPVRDLDQHVILLIETEETSRAALIVDRIVDQRQVVIKSLEENYGHVPGVAAATILGNGQIALILDTDDLVARTAPAPAIAAVA
ncbi:chemotaxis protein CheA [Parvularcula oceani]|uniref:chemotaxis protein CheA n=1 Tax=Parvularcula oceani TaxID=1247963 RepID=UPI0004E15DD3|nr:chemotaxis protein CheA [Parvularcula oceani]